MADVERLSALLAKRGWSPAELARAAGVERWAVWLLLHGFDSWGNRLYRVAQALGTTSDYLLGGPAPPSGSILPELADVLYDLTPKQQHEVLVYAMFRSGRLGRPTGPTV